MDDKRHMQAIEQEIKSLMLINTEDIDKLDSNLKLLNLSRFAFKSMSAQGVFRM